MKPDQKAVLFDLDGVITLDLSFAEAEVDSFISTSSMMAIIDHFIR